MKINRNWLADTLALISFTVVTGMFIEMAIVGMTLKQSLFSRLLCQPINITLGRVYGIYRDWVMRRICINEESTPRKIAGDITAYLTFQLPPYIGILVFVGMNREGIFMAAISQTVALVLLGAPYGQWLSLVRNKLALQPINNVKYFRGLIE